MIGRAPELAALRRAAASVGSGGTAVVVRGLPGTGRSTLLGTVADELAARGFRLLRCMGFEGDPSPGFAALHEVLHPLLDHVDALPGRQAEALRAAFGMGVDALPDRLLIGLGALGLVEAAATVRPLVLVVDDAHWLDGPSREVLSFVARRLGRAPVVMLVSVRTGTTADRELDDGSLVRLTLPALDGGESEELVRDRFPDLPDDHVKHVVSEAAGNPLALVELAAGAAVHGVPTGHPFAPRLVPTPRLQNAFLADVERLPGASRRLLLLLAAAGVSSPVDQLLAAGDLVEDDVVPAEEAGVVHVTGGEVAFRHELVRSAVYNAASASERAAAHRALGGATADWRRAAWHRAAAAHDHDERVAAGLQAAAEDACRRGAPAEAFNALRRAAELTPDPRTRVRRRALAAEFARRAGRGADASTLLAAAAAEASEPRVLSLLHWTDGLLAVSTGASTRGSEAAAQLVAGMGAGSRDQRGTVLLNASAYSWLTSAPAEALTSLVRAARDLADEGDDWPSVLCRAFTDTAAVAREVKPLLRAHVEATPATSPPEDLLDLGGPTWFHPTGLAALAVHDLATAELTWDEGLRAARDSGSVADEALILAKRGLTRTLAGDLAGAVADGERATRLAAEFDLPAVADFGVVVVGLAQAPRGGASADHVLSSCRAVLTRSPNALVAAAAHWAIGLIALDEGRNWDAHHELSAVSVHPALGWWAFADLAEAAVRTGRTADVHERVPHAVALAEALDSDHLRLLAHRAGGLLDEGDDADLHFTRSLAADAAVTSPLQLARTRLAYGAWLRRQRRIAEARAQLREAERVFETFGLRALSERAVVELEATGAGPQRADRSFDPSSLSSPSSLTPRERLVAELAADGMTNQEIADQLHLSPRTVGHHLFKAFPKLQVTKRTQLAQVLRGPSQED